MLKLKKSISVLSLSIAVLTTSSVSAYTWQSLGGGGSGKFLDGTNPVDAVYNDGKVGIGISNPAQALDVVGSINFSGSLYQNGSLFESGKFQDGTDSLKAVYMDGNVGIGIADPSADLSVGSTEAVRIYGTDNVATGPDIEIDSQGVMAIESNFYLNIDSDNDAVGNFFAIGKDSNTSSASELFRINEDGRVGIGTDSPDHELEINGSIELQTDNVDSKIRFHDPSNAFYSMGIDVSDSRKFKLNYGADVGEATHFVMTTGGNIGIGTVSPAQPLHINGIARADGGFQVDGNRVVGADGDNIYVYSRVIGNQSTVHQDGMYLNYNSSGGTAADLRFYANGTTERMRIDATNGNVGIGDTTPDSRLHVVGAGSATADIRMQSTAPTLKFQDTNSNDWWIHGNSSTLYFILDKNDNGDWSGESPWPLYLQAAGAFSPGFFYTSDETLKSNIKDLDNTQDILKITPRSFDWKPLEGSSNNPTNDIGVIAQEVEQYFPQFVSINESNGQKSVDYPKLVVPLIGVVKEQQNQIESLTQRLDKLEATLTQ